MIAKLSRGLIEDVGQEGRLSVATQLRRMVDRFVAYFEYDVVLIDARAGLAEITAGTWLSLGACKLVRMTPLPVHKKKEGRERPSFSTTPESINVCAQVRVLMPRTS